MKIIVAALALTSAAAFAPASAPRAATQLSAKLAPLDEAPGAGIFGASGEVWDPINMQDGRSREQMKYFQEAEIKHGRIAMLASLGFLVAEPFHPLFGGAIDAPSYLAFQATPLQTFWPAVLLVIGAYEITTSALPNFKLLDEGWWELKADYQPGENGFDPLGLKPTDEAELKVMKTKEINHCRLAMIGIAGMVGQELATGAKLF